MAVARHWVQESFAGSFGGVETLLARQVTLNLWEPIQRQSLGSEELLGRLARETETQGTVQIAQIQVFGERDRICVLYSADRKNGPISGVQFYRLGDGKLSEIWSGRVAVGVRWSWDPALTGDRDVEANRRAFAPWYDKVYASADWQSVPAFVGPRFLRHEGRELALDPEQYRQRLRTLFERTGPLQSQTEIVAAGDKVAVIGAGPVGGLFLRAWRIRNGTLVENGYVGPAAGG
jgi:hypothetical protein